MGKIFVMAIGLVMMAGGVYLAISIWWKEFFELVLGAIPPILFFVGLIAVIAGISSIKDAKRAKSLDEEALSPPFESETDDETEREEL